MTTQTKFLTVESALATLASALRTPKARLEAKGFDDKAAKIAKRLLIEATGNLTAFCSVTGLPIQTDMPASLEFTLSTIHPMAYNGRKLLQQPAYIKELNNAQLAGLILSLLTEANKLSISPKSNAYLVRAKLEAIATKNQLLDIIEWIANSLLTTTLFYPTLAAHHDTLTLESLQEYMEWTYSIETYSFAGSVGELIKEPKTKVKAPKRLVTSDGDSKARRFNRQFNSSLTDLIEAFAETTQDVIPSKVVVNLSGLLKGKVEDANPKLDGLLKACLEVGGEVKAIAQDMLDYRAAARAARETQAHSLDDLIDDYLKADTPSVEEEAQDQDQDQVEEVEEEAQVEEQTKELTFLEKLALAKAQATKKETV